MFELLGAIGIVFLSASFIPQIIKTHREKTVKDISLNYWLTLLIGFVFCFIYSISLGAWPFIFNYGWAIFCTLVFLGLYFKYRRTK